MFLLLLLLLPGYTYELYVKDSLLFIFPTHTHTRDPSSYCLEWTITSGSHYRLFGLLLLQYSFIKK
jgi:hypothetical protein